MTTATASKCLRKFADENDELVRAGVIHEETKLGGHYKRWFHGEGVLITVEPFEEKNV